MADSRSDWFAPGYRPLLDVVDDVGRLMHPRDYWPDQPAPRMRPPSPDPPGMLRRGMRVPSIPDQDGLIIDGPLWQRRCEEHRQPARDRLRTLLAEGELEAFALSSVHGAVRIEPKWWWG
jgi:hypothetical protein